MSPVTLLLSSRVRNWGPLYVRIVPAAAYLSLPNTSELHVAPEVVVALGSLGVSGSACLPARQLEMARLRYGDDFA